MTSQTVTDMTAFEADYERPASHRWPGKLPYRRSRAAEPQPGDIALCGAVKRVPLSQGQIRPADCEQCLRLSELLS